MLERMDASEGRYPRHRPLPSSEQRRQNAQTSFAFDKMAMMNMRRRVQVFLILLTLFVMFSSFDFAPAAGVLILEVTLLICDMLFLQESDFIFDPFYDNWEKKSMSKYN